MRLCGILTAWRRLQPCLLVLMTAIPHVLTSGNCPPDITYKTNQCLSTYLSLKPEDGSGAYYTGIDVERIRSICTVLIPAVTCVISMKELCPGESTLQILTIVGSSHLNMFQLCKKARIYELYSRHQYCYSRSKSGSQACLNKFQSQIAAFKDTTPDVHSPYCGDFAELTRCVEDNVRHTCGREAANLTATLVQASHANSVVCQDEPTQHSVTTTTQPHVGRTVSDEVDQKGARAHSAASANPRLSLCAGALVLVTSVMVNVLPVYR